MTDDERIYLQALSERHKEIKELTKKYYTMSGIVVLLAIFCGILLYTLALMQGKIQDLNKELTYYQEKYEETL